MIESPEGIKDHVGKDGILGVHKEDWNALLEYRAMKQEPDTFTIYQLKDDTSVDYHFRSLNELRGKGLSVSDVVVLHQNGQDTAHYVNDIGFADMSREFLHESEAVFHLDGENYLYIQTTDNWIDYTFYDKALTPQDGGQIDNPDLSMSEAYKVVLAFHDMTPEVIDRVHVMEFERLPELIDKEPAVTIRFSEHEAIDGGETYPLGEIDRLMERFDKEVRDAREDPEIGAYFKEEAKTAGMTVEEYAANGYEPIQKEPEPTPTVDELEARAKPENRFPLWSLPERSSRIEKPRKRRSKRKKALYPGAACKGSGNRESCPEKGGRYNRRPALYRAGNKGACRAYHRKAE